MVFPTKCCTLVDKDSLISFLSLVVGVKQNGQVVVVVVAAAAVVTTYRN